MAALEESLDGNFEGIGVEYNVLNDTITVISVMQGGPSQKAGILPGDLIISANGQSLTGKNSSPKNVRKLLRGPKESEVAVQILRKPSRKRIAYTLKRTRIPVKSIPVSYLLNSDIGYIRLIRFAEASRDELIKACSELTRKGMQKLVLDLRGNGGGLLNTAVEICDEFLSNGKMIVYTKGRSEARIDYRATSKGKFEQLPLVILIDENSASASEVVAGAIQDNDRGIIVGRRSFGKGLVQQEQKLSDGSGFRLTIARYYSPTGRCIQKSYANGRRAYANEERERYARGELLHADSIHFADSLKFKTPAGKIVYGGGGIMPDIFVPLDTLYHSGWFSELIATNIFTSLALEYALENRSMLEKKGLAVFTKTFVPTPDLLEKIITQAHLKQNATEEQRVIPMAQHYLKCCIARMIWDDEGFYTQWNAQDKTIQQAILQFQ